MTTQRNLLLGVAILTLLAFCGCAAKGPILVNALYQAPQGLVAGAPKVVVGICPIKDERGTSTSGIGRKSNPSSETLNDLVVQGTVAGLVTSGFKDALKARGITVKDVAEWDMSAEHIHAEDVDILVGGAIKKLRVDVVSSAFNVKYKADVQIQVAVANVPEKKLFRKLSLNTTLERKDVSFSAERLEKILSEALSSSIDQLLNDEEFKKSIK